MPERKAAGLSFEGVGHGLRPQIKFIQVLIEPEFNSCFAQS